MTNNSFFDESREQSLVKAEIVSKYFWSWSKIIINATRKKKEIAYVDLFSGSGRYKDGSKSTPLLILERAIGEPDIKNLLITIFNDIDSSNASSLKQAISEIPNISSLKHEPIVTNKGVYEEIVHQYLKKISEIHSLFFIDPWGYKGLSIELLGKVIMNWGCDCIFFFNYNRINMGLGNQAVEAHMNALFGQKRADELRCQISAKSSEERELVILEAISQSLQGIGGKYVLPFCFKNKNGSRTSHHLIFVSKHERGYSIMKEIMASESSDAQQGVSSFEYNIAPPRYPLLYALYQPLDELENSILNEFAGKSMTMIEVYNQHNIGTRYIKKNYKDALLNLEAQKKISTHPSKRRKNTFGDNVEVTFPSKH